MHPPSISRRLFHVATGLTLVLLIAWMGKEKGAVLAGSLLLVTILVETLRLKLPAVNRVLVDTLGPLLKESEISCPTGVGYFLTGALISLLLFRVEVALAGLVILAIGDPTAAIIGQRWGRIRIGQKSLEGAAGFVICALAAWVFFQGFVSEIPFSVYSIGVVAGAVVECLPLKIDDNLLLPLTAGLVMEVALRF